MLIDFHVFSIAFTLFLLMDALGNIPLFVSILKDFPPKKQRQIILRELLIALIIIVIFYFIGNLKKYGYIVIYSMFNFRKFIIEIRN